MSPTPIEQLKREALAVSFEDLVHDIEERGRKLDAYLAKLAAEDVTKTGADGAAVQSEAA